MLQIVCRDVWALHLTLLPSPPPPEPFLYAQDTGGSRHEQQKDPEENSEVSESSTTSSESEKDSESESLPEADDDSPTSLPIPTVKRRNKRTSPYEVLASTVAVLVLACWIMRIPIIYMDFIR